MPIDASIIPREIKPVNFGTLGDTAKLILDFQRGQQALETGGLQLQKLQQEMDLNKASSKAIQANTDENGNVDIPSVIKMLSKSPEAATNLAPTITSLLGQQGVQNENVAKQLGNLVQKNTIAGQRLGAMTARIAKGENITPAEHIKEMSNLIAENVLTPNEALLHLRMSPTPTGDKVKDQKAYNDFIKSEHFATQSNANQLNSLFGTLQPGGNGQPAAIYNPITQTLEPVNYGNPQQPANPNVPAQPAMPGQMGMGQPNAPVQDQIAPQLMFPVRQPGTNYAQLPNEATKTTEGGQYVSNLIERKRNLVADRRTLDDMIKQVQKVKEETPRVPGTNPVSNALNATIRKASVATADPEYQELSKLLAQMQIANLKAGGSIDTVAGQELLKYANGTEIYDPNVLLGIARRTKADMKNIDLQTDAATKFIQRYGPNNMDTFKKIWSDNADSKLFEMMNHHEDKTMTPEQKKMKRDELIGITSDMSAEKKKELLKEFQDKNNVIQKLVNTGGL